MKKFLFKKQNGFSLAEIVISVAILVLVFLGIFQSFPYALTIVKTSEFGTEAAYLAQAKIETIMQLDYDNIPVGIIEPRHALGLPGTYLSNFERQTEVEYVDNNLNSSAVDLGLKKIITTVFYLDQITKTEKSYQINILISKLN